MQYNQAANFKRREKDVVKLMMSGKFQVDLINEDSFQDFEVVFEGPPESSYEGGFWKVRVSLPDMYPYKSPSIGFLNRIYHPNIDEASGSVCLDVINQTWSPMYELINIFEIFLPQLLLYPNPTDPLNPEAAQMQLKYEKKYLEKIKDYVKRYAQKSQIVIGAAQSNLKNQSQSDQKNGGEKLEGTQMKTQNSSVSNKNTNHTNSKAQDNLSETSLQNGDDDDDDDDDMDMLGDDEDLDNELKSDNEEGEEKIQMVEKQKMSEKNAEEEAKLGD